MQNSSTGVEAALVGAVIAALGYVAKLAIEGFLNWNTVRRARRADLVELQSLLLVLKRAFEIQNALVVHLSSDIKAEHGISGNYDETLAEGFPLLTEKQKLAHGLIRNYTIHAILPLNNRVMDWLSKDKYFKGGGGQSGTQNLGLALQKLEAHLTLWRAKYELWIPTHPERAIVYMFDEKKHGIRFPKGIEDMIAQITGWAPETEDVPRK
jgi:hypothetical protein